MSIKCTQTPHVYMMWHLHFSDYTTGETTVHVTVVYKFCMRNLEYYILRNFTICTGNVVLLV